MNNLKYAFLNLFRNLRLFFIFLILLVILTCMLYNISYIFIDNGRIKNQFANFDFKNLYTIRHDFENSTPALDEEQINTLNKLMQQYVLTVSTSSIINFKDQRLEGVLVSNFDTYNLEYIDKKEPIKYNDGININVIIGNKYANNTNVGDSFPIVFSYFDDNANEQVIKLNANVTGVLAENQYMFNGVNGIQKTDNKVIVDYEEIYPLINQEFKSSFIQDILGSAVIKNPNNVNNIDFEKSIYGALGKLDLDDNYNIKPLLEREENIYLILKSRYDTVLFIFLVTIFLSTLIIYNYLKVIYEDRKKYYSVLILYGQRISSIIVQLIIELEAYLFFVILICYVIINYFVEVNYSLLLGIVFFENLLLVIPILLIFKFDNKIVKLIKGVR